MDIILTTADFIKFCQLGDVRKSITIFYDGIDFHIYNVDNATRMFLVRHKISFNYVKLLR